MTTLVWAVVCIVLAAAGASLGYWFGNRRRAEESAKRDAVQAELDDYRKRVNEHFGETATRFHDLGRQYRELYEHMAVGSQELCKVEAAGGKLPFALADRPTIADDGSAAQDGPGSEAAVQSDQERTAAEDLPQAAEEIKAPAADEDKQQPGDRTTEQATESEAPRRTYH